MEKVLVRSADGQFVEMLAVEKEGNLIYVIAIDSVERMNLELTEPVGCPIEDIVYI